jgi:hypothetical protein
MGFEDRLKDADSINLEPDSKITASLCLYADCIDIDLISNYLGCKPTKAHRKGDLYPKKTSPPARVGAWILDAPEHLTFLDQLKFLVEATPDDKKIWDILSETHRIKLSCTIGLNSWTDGFEIPAAFNQEIGTRHWVFGISVFSASGDAIVDAFLKPAKNLPKTTNGNV